LSEKNIKILPIVDVYERIILKWILNKCNVKVCAGFSRDRLPCGIETLGSTKNEGNLLT
jgi:hypothetical protein